MTFYDDADVQVRRGSCGLAYALLLFFGAIVIGAMLLVVLQQPLSVLGEITSQHADMEATQTGLEWTQQAWEWFPLFVGLLAVFGLIARSVLESRGGP